MRTNRLPLAASRDGSRRPGWRGACLAASLVVSCAASRPPPALGTSALTGTLRLVPHEGVTLPGRADSYGDRALRDAELVDYSSPGFAVVSVAGLESPRGTVRVTLRSTRFASRFEPRYAAVGVGGEVAIRNGDDQPRALSCPGAGVLTSVAPGAEVTVAAARSGELRCFALDRAEPHGEAAEATVYVAPGPYTVVDSDGGFVLDGLGTPPAGASAPATVVVVWHPRFPPLERSVALVPGSSERLDLELRVR
ncbi:MAG: hypothetical protein IPK07_15455 [Deltaproteobacteria bacterium]|jgi:hypothetical protein|nr:hypothetical protein [Deltaproteobacteria bacterium]